MRVANKGEQGLNLRSDKDLAMKVAGGRFYTMGCGAFAALAIVLGGCSTVGDFGRPKESTLLTEVAKNYDKVQGIISPHHSNFELSQEEMDIRKAAYHFHQPLPSPLWPTKFANMIKKSSLGSLSDYADSMTSRGHIDGNARAGELDELMAADHLWLKRFGRAGRLTRISDRERLIVLEQSPGAFSDDDRINTHARIEENADIMLAVLADLDKRLSAYHYAIQRTRLEWPRTPLSRTETSLSQLRETAARLRVELGFDGTGLQFEEIETVETIVEGRPGPRPPKMHDPKSFKQPARAPAKVHDKANVMPGFEDPLLK